MFTVRALREATVPILVLAVLAVAAGLWSWWAAAPVLLLLVFTVAFFRDPRRRPPEEPGAILAPADGRVMVVDSPAGGDWLEGDVRRVAIFLSIFDVHVQRSPIRGRISLVRHQPGGHLDARRPDCSLCNENRLVRIEAEDGFRIAVRQIAGLVARRIVGWAGEGARLAQGERLGMIRFGSRVELIVPAQVEIAVRVGQHVKGGETVLARRR